MAQSSRMETLSPAENVPAPVEKRIVVALALYTRFGDILPNVGRGVAAPKRLPTNALAAMATLVPVPIETWTVGAV